MRFPVPRAASRRRELDRYGAWSAAVRALRGDWAGGRPPGPAGLAAYLDPIPTDQRPEALEDLVAEHLKLSWQVEPGPTLEDYVSALRLDPISTDLVEDEFLARCRPPHGDAPGLDDYERRFPGRTDVLDRLEARLLGGGRYVALRRLGSGATGDVLEALDRSEGRLVAAKRLRRGVSGAPEAAALARLDHPGIVRLEAHFAIEDEPEILVLERLDGRTLASRLAAGEPRGGLLAAFLAVCEAVAHAHARGVVHGDLKPGNVLVSAEGRAVVLDWGLAAGTPESMAPEQVDRPAGARSDVFGLGAILFEIATGRPPRTWPEGSRPGDWADRVRTNPVEPPRRTSPRGLAAVLARALAHRPEERFESAEALATEVRRVVEPVTMMGRLRRAFGHSAKRTK